jgi:exosortase E/protease (VPEID-CTERM system)
VLQFLFLVVVFAIELTLLSLSVDGQSLFSQTGFAAHLLGAWGMPVVRVLVTTAGLAGTFIYLKRRAALESFGQSLKRASTRSFPIALHVILFAILLVAGRRLYGAHATGTAMVTSFVSLGVAVLLSGLATIAPMTLWARLARATWSLWACAAGAALAAQWMTTAWRQLWTPASYVTYRLVAWMVQPLVGRLIIQPERMRIATDRFGVIVSPDCSGMEGMGLLLLFGGLWLWFFRKECRFPQALLLLPAGLAVLFVLNSARIAALLLIGHAGAPQIATEGFHSQAGWIAFNGVAFGLCIVAGRVRWIAMPAAGPQIAAEVGRAESGEGVNPVAAYLGPFLAILAAGMLARAMTGGFEWMYPLRVVAACAVLWHYRRAYLEMDWRMSWRGPAVGIAVFGVWMAFEWAFAGSAHASVPAALDGAGAGSRWSWIAFRVLGATAAVPLAEELAFRGYLLRRVVTEDFDRLAANRSTLPALAISSVLFGAMHGSRWLAGTVAGLLYGWVYRQKGQLGDAVVAHAVTNGLIAAAVLALGWWKLW